MKYLGYKIGVDPK